MAQTVTTLPPLVAFTQATLDKRDAERRIDENRADAMGEVLTCVNSGKKAVALDHEVIYIKGGQILDVHGTLRAIAKAEGLQDELDGPTAVETLLRSLATNAKTGVHFTKRADSLRVL